MWIPLADISGDTVDRIKKSMTRHLYDERVCRMCEHKPDRPCYACQDCEAYGGVYEFYAFTENGKYVGIDYGDRAKVLEFLPPDYEIVDKRCRSKFSTRGIQFNWDSAFDYQVPAIKEMVRKRRGVLESQPRTGKTVMGSAIVIELGMRAIILAHQEDLLSQFYNTLMNIDTPVNFTNIPQIEEETGTKIVGICTKLEDFAKYDICLCTYQMFLSPKGKKRLKAIANTFGTLIVDEVHRGAAEGYSEVISRFNAFARMGMTATYDRKDQKHFVVRNIIGVVEHSTPAKSLTPIVSVIDTGATCRTHYKVWAYAMRFLERNQQRNRIILKYLKKDIEAGRHILIPVTFQSQCTGLVKVINRMMGRKVAASWYGGLTKPIRKETLNRAREGKIKVTVAQRSMLTGINVQVWDCIYEIMPINNPPNFRQEYRRICTPLDGKPQPVIRFFVDRWSLVQRCFLNCVQVLKEDKVDFTERANQHVKATRNALRLDGSNFDSEDPYKPKVNKRKYDPVTKGQDQPRGLFDRKGNVQLLRGAL
jgi:superfamily II DNA or RNA helicase